jgi:hypothetical protein
MAASGHGAAASINVMRVRFGSNSAAKSRRLLTALSRSSIARSRASGFGPESRPSAERKSDRRKRAIMFAEQCYGSYERVLVDW